MKTKGHATFAFSLWDEKPYMEMDGGAKLTQTHQDANYEGDITGISLLKYLMCYNPDASGNYVGIEHIDGSLGGKKGSFVMQHSGTFEKVGVQGTWFVVPGSATGELKGLRAEGTIGLEGHMERYPTDFEYEFVDEPETTSEK